MGKKNTSSCKKKEEKGGLIIDWDNCCNQHIIRGIDKVKKMVM